MGMIANFLQQVYNLFPLLGTNGGVIVRQKGGTPGVNEVQIWHDGTDATIQNLTSAGIVKVKGQDVVANVNANRYFYVLDSGAGLAKMIVNVSGMGITSASQLFWTSSSTDAFGTPDTGLQRTAAGVVGFCDGNVAHYALKANASGLISGNAVAPSTVNNKALTTNVATLTTSAAHNLVVGQVVVVSGVDATFNSAAGTGDVVLSVPSTTTFTYARTHADVGSTGATGTTTPLAMLQMGIVPVVPDALADVQYTQSVAGQKFVLQRTGSGTGGDILQLQSQAGARVFGISDLGGINFGSYVLNTGAWAANYNGTGQFTVLSTGQYGWSANSTVSGANDTAVYRVAVGVVGSSRDAGTTKDWFQDSAGSLALVSPFTDNTGTLAATTFSFPVISGRTYKIFGYIAGNNTTGTEGIQFAFDGGAASASAFLVDVESLGLGTVVLGTSQASALNTPLTATTFINGRLRVTGYLVASSTGTIIMRAAEVSHAAGTLTINAGSWITFADMRSV